MKKRKKKKKKRKGEWTSFLHIFSACFEDENDGKMVGNLYAEGAGWDVETVKMVESEKASDGRGPLLRGAVEEVAASGIRHTTTATY